MNSSKFDNIREIYDDFDLDELCAIPTPELVERIADDDVCSYPIAVELAKRNATECIPHLIELLDHEQPGTIASALIALDQLESIEAVPSVTQLLNHDDPHVVAFAASALGHLQVFEAIPRLIKLLNHNHADVVTLAAIALADLKANDAVPRLIELLDRDEPRLIAGVASSLSFLQAVEAVPRLIELLNHDDPLVISCASIALSALQASEATPSIMQRLNHDDPVVIEAAARALGPLQATQSIPQLLQLLDHDDIFVLSGITITLGQLKATEAVPFISRQLDLGHPTVVAASAYALGELNAIDAVPRLIELLDHDDPHVIANAASALGKLKAEDATPRWINRLAHTLGLTIKRVTRSMLRSTMYDLPSNYEDHIRFLELVLDPQEHRRLTRIPYAFQLPTIQHILESVMKERSRRTANGAQVRTAIESEFCIAAIQDPLFRTPMDRLTDQLFANIRKRMSGVAHRIITREHSPPSGKKTENGRQTRVWQNTNYSDQFFVAETGHTTQVDDLAEVYGFLKEGCIAGLISPRQQRLFELLCLRGLNQKDAARSLTVSTKTVQREFYEMNQVIRRHFCDP